jgi:hypothetical protein
MTTLSDADLGLLRRFEPLLKFTHGELFLPMATGPFVEACDLLEGPTLREARVAIPSGELDLDRLGAVDDPPPGHSQYLRFVPKPMSAVELARWRNRPDAPRFEAPGRLARVGLAARLVDAGLVTSLLLRGRVPGGTTAAASVRYDAIRARDPRTVYHARVRREGPWIVLHYLFFYAMNDWRSTFDGANDHESDWEQCFVILEALPDGDARPAWFCAAAHDEKGDDLRRRWDDPRLEKSGEHPVVYPGAGSHATYLERGEYIMSLPFPGEQNLHGPLDLLRGFWRDTLSQPDPGDLAGKVKRALSVPFVDYARGDGVSVGPGGDHEWVPIPIGDDDPWVDGYRGLWGLDTGDRFAGERAPAGPKYTRTGSVRQAWYDPLGFAGLSKVAPPSQRIAVLESRVASLTAEREAATAEASSLAESLPAMEQEVAALRETSGLEHYAAARMDELVEGEAKLGHLRQREVELSGAIAAAERRVVELQAGRMEDPRAHLRHASEPEPPAARARRAHGETWAALSVGLLVVALAVIVWFKLLPPILAVVVLFGTYLAIEAFFSRAVAGLVLRISVALALITAIILAVTFLREIVLLGLLALGLLLVLDNVAEVRRRRSA